MDAFDHGRHTCPGQGYHSIKLTSATEVVMTVKPEAFCPMAQGEAGIGVKSIVMRGPDRMREGCRGTDMRGLGEDALAAGTNAASGDFEEKRIKPGELPGEEDFKLKKRPF